MKTKTRFASKGQSMLTGKPASLEDFLGDKPSLLGKSKHGSGYTENRETKTPDNRIPVTPNTIAGQNLERRFELKIPDDLAKQINDHAFEHRISKAAVVIQALEHYFKV